MTITRRELLRNAALAAAATAIGRPALAGEPAAAPVPAPAPPPAPPKLSAAAAAEVEARYQTILRKYPGRFGEKEKALVHKSCVELQPELEKLREFPLANSDEPAHVFRPR